MKRTESMTRAELAQWAAGGFRFIDPATCHTEAKAVAYAVTELLAEFKALRLVDGVPGYQTLREDPEVLKQHNAALSKELDRLRKSLSVAAPWEAAG